MAYKRFGEFLRDVWEAGKGSQKAVGRLKTAGHLEEGADSMGGFLVGEEHYNQLMGIALEESIVRPRANILSQKKQSLVVPTLVDSDHSSSIFGGIVCYWTDEAAAKTEKNPTVGAQPLRAKKLVGFVYLSDEWMDDSAIQVEEFLKASFGKAIAFYADDAYINGTGVAQPLGILNAPCIISQAKESGQSADTVVWENVVNMDSRLLPQSQKKAIWLINSDIKPQIFNMTNSTTVVHTVLDLSGANNGMWMFGHEIVPTEKAQTLGDKGDIILADFSQYVIGDRGLQIEASEHYSFNTDETCWRFVLRTDGQPLLSSAITPKNSSTTVSPFVTLAERAA